MCVWERGIFLLAETDESMARLFIIIPNLPLSPTLMPNTSIITVICRLAARL